MYKIVFNLLVCVCWVLFRLLFRLRVTGLENVPAGGAIIAPNHQSFWDIPLVGFVLYKRRTHFMAKSELFNNQVFAWIIRTVLAFPVKRGTPDRTAIRHAIDMLKQGDLIAIFPEGTRSKTGKLGPPEAGLSLIAAKAGVPVVPVGIVGTRLIFSKTCRFPQLLLAFGKPICILESEGGKASLENLGPRVMEEISNLIDNNP
ncbi:MAG: lysophospholipid acyltransferase family protein [Negativicutes bacterium]